MIYIGSARAIPVANTQRDSIWREWTRSSCCTWSTGTEGACLGQANQDLQQFLIHTQALFSVHLPMADWSNGLFSCFNDCTLCELASTRVYTILCTPFTLLSSYAVGASLLFVPFCRFAVIYCPMSCGWQECWGHWRKLHLLLHLLCFWRLASTIQYSGQNSQE